VSRSWSRTISLLFVLAVVQAACSGSDGAPGPASSTTATTDGAATSVTASSGDDLPEDLPDDVREIVERTDEELPLVLSIDPATAAPGDTVTISGLDGVNAIALLGPDGTLAETTPSDGGAVLVIPAGAPEGAYAVVVEGAAGLRGVAAVTVASGPTVHIRVDGTRLNVEAHGVPADAPAVVEIENDAAWGAPYEASGDRLILASAEPVATLGDYLDGPLLLPPTAEGAITLVLLDADSETAGRSNTVVLASCDAPAVLVGDIGGPGEVRAVWSGPRPGTAAAAADGPYRLEAAPGLVAVTEIPLVGEPRILLAEARCGTETEVTEDGPSAFGVFSTEGLDQDQRVGAVAGDVEATFDGGIAVCTPLGGGSVDISLLDDLDFTFGVVVTLDGYSGSGTYTASGIVIDGAGRYSEGSFRVVATDEDGILAGSLSGHAAGGAGDVSFDAAFRCAMEHPLGLDGPPGLFASYRESRVSEPCRLGLVAIPEETPAAGAAVTRWLAAGLPLVEWNTNLDAAALLNAAAQQVQKRLGDGQEQIEAARRIIGGADYYATVDVRNHPEWSDANRVWLIVRVFDTKAQRLIDMYLTRGPDLTSVLTLPGFGVLVEKVAAAGICGSVDPEEATLAHGEQQSLAFSVADLSDRPVGGARVTIEDRRDGGFSEGCGTFAQESGETGGDGMFTATFTAANEVVQDCAEYPRFRATATTTAGEVQTQPDRERTDATIHVGTRWLYWATLTSRGPDGDLVWHVGTEDDPGFFFVREDGNVVGGAVASFDGVRSCEVYENDVLTYKEPLVTLQGSWTSYLSGRLVDEEYFDFRFEGVGWDSNWPPLAPECRITGLSEVGEGVLELFAYRPDIAPTHPVHMTPKAATVTFAVPADVLPGADLTVTIRLDDQEPSG